MYIKVVKTKKSRIFAFYEYSLFDITFDDKALFRLIFASMNFILLGEPCEQESVSEHLT